MTNEHNIVTPYTGFNGINIKELIKHKNILLFLIWRDIKLRYKQTKIGILWLVFQPLLSIIIYTLFFGILIKVPTNNVPYALFFFSGFLPWLLCMEGVSRSSTSIIGNSNLVSKVYFPKLYLPLCNIITPTIDFSISSVILIALMIFYGYSITWKFIFIPVVIILCLIVSFAVGTIICTLNTKYRDFQNLVPHIIQVWSYSSPIIYPLSMIPIYLISIYIFNPTVIIIELMRWIVIGTPFPTISMMFGYLPIILLAIFGLVLFKSKEHQFVELV